MKDIEERCGKCGASEVFTRCTGCGVAMCVLCSRFELIGSGCGCVWPVYYCPACAADPLINPNALFRESEKSQ